MKSSLEIAHAAVLEPIDAIASAAGLEPDETEPYGRYKAKVLAVRCSTAFSGHRPDGKLIAGHGHDPDQGRRRQRRRRSSDSPRASA